MQNSSIVDYRGRCVNVESRADVRQALYLLTLQPWIREEAQRQATVAVWMKTEAESGRRTVYRSD